MSNHRNITLRHVQKETDSICSLLKSLDQDMNHQAASKLGILIGAFRDSAAIKTKTGKQICDLLVRARENLRLGCVDDALRFLWAAQNQAAIGLPEG